MKYLHVLLALAAGLTPVFGQTNPRAWYAHGQVWVVWTANTNNPPETYAIYSSPNPFTNTADALLVGRLFQPEWSADNLKSQMKTTFGSAAAPTGYRIPRPGGGTYTLLEDEGIFVHTVRASGSTYYAVVPWGETSVTNSNIITNAVSFTYDLNEPPRPQLQARGASLGTGHVVSIFMLFVDGDEDMNAGRPDFPILANHHKRGSPHLFLTVEPLGGLPGPGPWPASMCFHGSNGDAVLWLPSNDGPRSVNVAPTDGYVIAFDDELYSLLNGQPFPYNTRWIGYVPSFDPFTNIVFNPTADIDGALDGDFSAFNPPSTETIVNYTQRRILWILDWLIANANIDSNRVSLLGHSAGSMGAQSLARAYPDRISSLQLFNCGMRYFISAIHAARQGDSSLNLPVTLTNHLGQPVHLLDLLYFTNRIVAARDLPFTRQWHGKCDENGAMLWRGDMLNQMRFCDREGWGLHFYWDLRKHGTDQWKDYWVDATSVATRANQTQRDDVRNQSRYRAQQSYPAFFNLQSYTNHGEPGPGWIGGSTTNSPCGLATDTNGAPVWNGDDHGTWGGYFDWETDTITDTPTHWQCTLFLVNTNSGYAEVDASPYETLTADIAIRRPQQFLPGASSLVRWEVRNATNGNLLVAGTNSVGAESLVTVPGITVPRDPKRLRLIIAAVPPPPPPPYHPTLYIGMSGIPGHVDLYWFASSNHSYYLEQTLTFTNWSVAGAPIPAPMMDGWMTNTVAVNLSNLWFRLRADPLIDSPVPAAPGVYSLHLSHDNLARSYRLNIPAGYNPLTAVPLVIMHHGGGQTADEIAAMHPALAYQANTNGMILVLPQSTHNERSTSWYNFDPDVDEPYVNDVGFITALIDRLDAELNIDRSRVYAAGFSAGGIMCHYLAARTTNTFAAIASIGSSIASELRNSGIVTTTPPPSGPIPALIVNATNDCLRPYFGGYNSVSNYIAPAIAAAYHYTNANVCSGAPAITTNNFMSVNIYRFENCDTKPNPSIPQPNQVIRMHWSFCTPGTEVIFVTLTDGGHLWPDENDNVGLDANYAVIEFFKRH